VKKELKRDADNADMTNKDKREKEKDKSKLIFNIINNNQLLSF
jgi:hypothetical protein